MTPTKEERARLRELMAADRRRTASAWLGSSLVLRPQASSPWVIEAERLLDALADAEAPLNEETKR